MNPMKEALQLQSIMSQVASSLLEVKAQLEILDKRITALENENER